MRWFISYCFNDEKEHCIVIKKWAKKGLLGENVIIFVEKEDKRKDGKEAIKDYLRENLKKSNGLLILIGDNCHNRPWMDYEVDVANSLSLPIIPIRISNTTGGPPSKIRNYTLIAYQVEAIKETIQKSKK